MAFVFRSDLISSISPKKQNTDVGPGQYIPQTETRNNKKSKVPFLTGSKRAGINQQTREERDNPGPGAYYHDEMFENFYKNIQKDKQIYNQKISNIKAINKFQSLTTTVGFSTVIANGKNVESLGFLGKDIRFKMTNDKKICTPGPGHYIKSKDRLQSVNVRKKSAFTINRVLNPDDENIKINGNKVISIPGKNQAYGYEIDEDHKIILNDDPENYKRFKGEKNDTVGPGNYNVDAENVWFKKGNEWSKCKTLKSQFGDTLNNKDNNNINNYPQKQNNNQINNALNIQINNKLSRSFEIDIGDLDKNIKNFSDRSHTARHINKNNKNVFKNNNIRKNNRKEMIKYIMNTNSEPISMLGAIQNKLEQGNPGPGYYYDNNQMSSFKPVNNPEHKQNFQSNLARFNETNKNDTVGPGTYFKNNNANFDIKNQLQSDKKKVKIFPVTTVNKLGYIEKNAVPETPGPGQYDPNIQFNAMKTFSAGGNFYFGSTEKRFAEVSKVSKVVTPGPGSYIDSNFTTMYSTGTKWNNNNIKKDIRLMQRANTSRPRVDPNIRSERLQNPELNEKNQIPPVGTYNPDFILSIDYKIKKGNSKLSLIEAPFNTTLSKRRFEEKKDDISNLGPGYYYKEKRTKSKQNYSAFSARETRFIPGKGDDKPGFYNQNSYYDWNKKTYNMLYL